MGRRFREALREEKILGDGPIIAVQHDVTLKWKWEGEVALESPFWVVYLGVDSSLGRERRYVTTLPVPAAYVGAIFVFRRDPDHPMDEFKTRYERVATPQEFYTLTDFNNRFNRDPARKLGSLFLSHSVWQAFRTYRDAEAFRDRTLGEVVAFSEGLQRFHDAHPEMRHQRKGIAYCHPSIGILDDPSLKVGTAGVGELPKGGSSVQGAAAGSGGHHYPDPALTPAEEGGPAAPPEPEHDANNGCACAATHNSGRCYLCGRKDAPRHQTTGDTTDPKVKVLIVYCTNCGAPPVKVWDPPGPYGGD